MAEFVECPESEDGLHCGCWYDGDACCECDAPEMPMEDRVRQGMVEGPVREDG